MLSYILEVSICWGAFYLLYWLLLSRDTFFHFNRWYLVSTLLASLVIPAVEWELPHRVAESEIATVYFQPITVGVETFEVTVTATPITSGVELLDVLTWVYWAGMVFCMLRFLIGMRQIYRLYRRSEKRYRNGYQLILSEKVHPPFSFFNSLFLSKSVELDPEDRDAILRHELAHIRGGHSIDIILLEILNAVFWCSPFIYLYRRSLRNVHEYIADAAVLRTTKRKQYGHLLIRQSQSGPAIAIANHFHSQLKKRILMMMRNPSKRRAMFKYLLVIPLTLLVLLVFSNAEAQESLQQQAEEVQEAIQNVTTSIDVINSEGTYTLKAEKGIFIDTIPYDGKSVIPISENIRYLIHYPGRRMLSVTDSKEIGKFVQPDQIEKINVDKKENLITIWLKEQVPFQEVDELALFPGCEGEKDAGIRQNCSHHQLRQYIAQNIRYPAAARENGVEGEVLVSFVVNEKGQVQSPKIQRSIGSNCDQEVLRMIQAMPTWTPAQKNGKPVASEFTLPVTFKLQPTDPSKVVLNPETYETHIKSTDDVVVVGQREEKKEPLMLPDPVFERLSKQVPPPASLFSADVLQILDGKILSESELQELEKKFKQAGGRMSTDMLTTLTPEAATKKYGEKGKNGAIIYQGLKFGASKENNSEIFKVVEEMPRFPGCEDKFGDEMEKKNCADREMLKFVYQNLKYPKQALDKGIQGMVVVSFVVGKDGKIREPKVVREIGGGCGEEVIRLVNSMPLWIPGRQKGQAVDVQFNLPVRFHTDQQTEPNLPMVESLTKTLQLQSFSASPNPSNGIVNLTFQGERKPTFIKVFDLQGKELQSLYLANFNGRYNEQLDLSQAPKGTLIISIIQGDQIYSERILVQ